MITRKFQWQAWNDADRTLYDSLLGPHEELAVLPGQITEPGGSQKSKSRLRIWKIYVNQGNTCFDSIHILTRLCIPTL